MDIKVRRKRENKESSLNAGSVRVDNLSASNGKLARLRGVKLPRKSLLAGAVVAVVMGTSGVAGYSYYRMEQIKKDPQTVARQEAESVTAKLGKLMSLPRDEHPTIATVKDRDKLKDQPFFKDAQNGDKLLIYTKARQAIIYREKENKIVNVGPITGTDTVSQR